MPALNCVTLLSYDRDAAVARKWGRQGDQRLKKNGRIALEPQSGVERRIAETGSLAREKHDRESVNNEGRQLDLHEFKYGEVPQNRSFWDIQDGYFIRCIPDPKLL